LLGFDNHQYGQLRSLSAKKSQLRGKLDDKDKWNHIYRIVFPDVKESGLPNPFYEPNIRDTIRYERCLKSSNLIFQITPEDVRDWQRSQPSNNLSLEQFDQPGHSPSFQLQIHEAPVDRPAQWADTLANHPFPDENNSFTTSSMGDGHVRIPSVDNRNSYYPNTHTMSQLNDLADNFLSPSPRWTSPSEIGSRGGLTWGSSAAQGSAPYSQASAISQIALHSPPTDLLYSEMDQAQFSGPSVPGLEDQLQIGALFPPETGQSKKFKPPG